MLLFIARRMLQTIPTIFAIATLTFFCIRLAPGGPFSSEKQIDPIIQARLNVCYGLDKPLFVQYLNYLASAFKGDLGPSFRYPNRTVSELISGSFGVSLELGSWALLIALCIGIPGGIVAALRKNSLLDYIPMSLSMAGICIPTFVLGPLLVLFFALWWPIFHVSGWNSVADRLLPAITLGLPYAAWIARLCRSGMLETLHQDFIKAARAKGLSEYRVIVRHALKGGLLPVVSFLGPAIAGLITGSFVVETIFSIPGLGRLFVTAAFNRDYTLIMGTVLLYSTIIIFCNMLVDIALVMLNPKLRIHQ